MSFMDGLLVLILLNTIDFYFIPFHFFLDLKWLCIDFACFKYPFMFVFHAIFAAYLPVVGVHKPQRCKFISVLLHFSPSFLFFYLCVIIVPSYPFYLCFNISLLCPVTYKLLAVSCVELFFSFEGFLSSLPRLSI